MEEHKPSASRPPAPSPRGHVMFNDPEASPAAPSPRAMKILSRKKTPFAEDLKSSLEAFRAMEAAEAVVDAQQAVRAEEAARLASVPPPDIAPLPTAGLPPGDSIRAKKPPRSVTVVSPPSAAAKRAEAAAAAAATEDDDDVKPTTLLSVPVPDKAAPPS